MGIDEQHNHTVLVLCHTIFHNAFRSENFGQVTPTQFRKYVQSKFIADFVLERGAELPEGALRAITSQKIFDEFCLKLEGESKSPEVFEYINILKTVIQMAPDEQINTLDENEGIIVIADILRNRSKFEPVVITDMKDSMKGKAVEFYKDAGIEESEIPFSVENLEDAIPFLRGRFPDLYKSITSRDVMFNLLK